MRQISGQSNTDLGKLRVTVNMEDIIFATALREITAQLMEGEPNNMLELMQEASSTGSMPNQLAEDIIKAGQRAMQDLTSAIQTALQAVGVGLIMRLMLGDPLSELTALTARENQAVERLQKESDQKYGGAE